MNNLLRLIAVGGLLLVTVLMIALGMARNTNDLLAPAHLLLFVFVVALYLLPTGRAMYRDCHATIWIALVNVFLGWTFFGWVVAIGWAASGKTRTLPPTIPTHPVPSH